MKSKIQTDLFEMQDLEYKAFHSRLMPGIDPDTIIGVRTPALRAYAKKLNQSEEKEAFLQVLPHTYYEENNLHGFLVSLGKDYDKVIEDLDRFLPYVNNWATCDMMRPKVFAKNKERLIRDVKRWMDSDDVYTKRFGIEMIMVHFLDDAFQPAYLDWLSEIRSEEYYINMCIAWTFATALAKQWDQTIPYIEKRKLDDWTHKKTIQKARESYRITKEQKEYLKTLL